MIAYHFPPEGNAGSHRPLRFVRQLPTFGWATTIVTAVPSQYERYDPTLVAAIPVDTEIIRINSADLWRKFQSWRGRSVVGMSSGAAPSSSGKVSNGASSTLRAKLREVIRLAEAWWYHPDMASPWIKGAVHAVTEVCRRDRVSVIWATAGPVSALYVARAASQKSGIPYVLDFRDSWTITHNDFESRRPSWAIRRDRIRMYELLRGAQAVIFRYHTEAECFWQAYRGALEASKIYIIPNGYESPIEEHVTVTGDTCNVLYTGTLDTYRYDSLLEALVILKTKEPSLAQQLRLLFVGEGMDSLANEADTRGLSSMIQTMGPKTHAEVAGMQREAHALLVLGRLPTINGYELFAGAKLFGYLKAGRPIVGILPSDETQNVLRRVGCMTVADVDSVEDITRVLRLLLDRWSDETLSSLAPDRKACAVYCAERQTETLAHALERLPAKEAFIPGAQTVPATLRARVEHIRRLLIP